MNETILCPYCKEEIKEGAIRCKHCHAELANDFDPTDYKSIISKSMEARYSIIEEVGHGGMAVVYKAYQKSTGDIVALKIIHANLARDDSFIERFLREARIGAMLMHPNSVRMLDVGSVGTIHYMAMEFIPGKTLKQIISEKGVLSEIEMLSIVKPIMAALEEAHSLGIIHRDIKSSNIIIMPDGSPKLMDFGIANATSDIKLTQTGLLMGTPEYMSPEQALGKKVDYRTDLYSIGAVMYECLTGRVPLKGENQIETIHKTVNEDPVKVSTLVSVSSSTEQIIHLLLSKNPLARPAGVLTGNKSIPLDVLPDQQHTLLDTNPNLKSSFIESRSNNNIAAGDVHQMTNVIGENRSNGRVKDKNVKLNFFSIILIGVMALTWIFFLSIGDDKVYLNDPVFEEVVAYEESSNSIIGSVELAIIFFVIGVQLVSFWNLFAIANKPGWVAFVPVYNLVMILRIVGRPLWWIILLIIPCVNIVVSFILYIDFAKSFGKDTVWGILLFLLGVIFLPILAFSSSTQYVGPAAAPSTPQY